MYDSKLDLAPPAREGVCQILVHQIKYKDKKTVIKKIQMGLA